MHVVNHNLANTSTTILQIQKGYIEEAESNKKGIIFSSFNHDSSRMVNQSCYFVDAIIELLLQHVL